MSTAARQLHHSQANQDTRLEDYLNDKLQTFADFDVIDSLLANVQTQQDLLQRQLEEARQEQQRSADAYQRASNAARQKSEEFQRQQANIDRTLMSVTQSDSTDDAVHKFDSAMGQLRRLDMTNAYLEMLDEVDKLRFVSTQIRHDPLAKLS